MTCMYEIKVLPRRGAGDLSNVPAFGASQSEQPEEGAQVGDIEECGCETSTAPVTPSDNSLDRV